MIRQAAFADIPRLMAVFAEIYARSRFAGIASIDVVRAKAVLLSAIQRRDHKRDGACCLFVSHEEGPSIDGFILGTTAPVYLIGDKLMATDLFFLTRVDAHPRAAAGLLDAFLAWAEAFPGVIEIKMGASDAVQPFEPVARLYRARGLVQSGVIYSRRVGP